MNKAEFTNALAERSGLTKANSAVITDMFLQLIEDTLKEGEDINFIGFGKFFVKKKDAKNARNPRTGETIYVEERVAPAFKISKTFSDKFKS